MSRRVRHICDKLSDWERVELYVDYRTGAPIGVPASRYSMSCGALRQTIDRIEAAARRLGLSTRHLGGKK